MKKLEDQLQKQRRELFDISSKNAEVVGTSASSSSSAAAPAGSSGSSAKAGAATTFGEFEEEGAVSTELAARVEQHEEMFKKARKEGVYKKLHTTLTSFSDNRSMQQVATWQRHQSTAPGVLCCMLNPVDRYNAITGGVDGNLESFNLLTGETLGKLEGHEHSVTCCSYHPKRPVLLSRAPKTKPRRYGTSQARTSGVAHSHPRSIEPLSPPSWYTRSAM